MKLTTLSLLVGSVLMSSSAVEAAGKRSLDVIVKLKPNNEISTHQDKRNAAKNMARQLGFSAKHAYGSALYGFAATIPEGRLQSLRNNPHVASVEIDQMMRIPDTIAAKPSKGGQESQPQTASWGYSRMGADQTINQGAGVHVYVLDSGVDIDHPDLQANIGNGHSIERCKGKGCATRWDDDHGHGTHVAGIIAAINNDIDVVGVAPQAIIHPVKICTSQGSCPASSAIAGIDWAASEIAARGEASVINMSIGGSGSKGGVCYDTGFVGDNLYHEAVCNAKNVGGVFAIAAGNDSADAENIRPGAYDDAAITASATTVDDDWPEWSNYGDNVVSWTENASAPVALAAPGVDILSLAHGGGVVSMSGTSMAAPHLAGAIALYLASNPQSADASAFHNTRAALLSGAEDSSGFSNTSGHPHSEDFIDVSGL